MRGAEFELPGMVSPTRRLGMAPAYLAYVDVEGWRSTALAVRDAGGRLISLWGADRSAGSVAISTAYELDDGVLWLELTVGAGQGYPDLSTLFPCATRMQRAVSDLLGVHASGAGDTRPWLDHGHWPRDYYSLRKGSSSGAEKYESREAEYAFVTVAGDGVHEIAVGPIHAGVIEPGHFRFSVVGEKVLRLEERLGYTHKGIDRLFERMPVQAGHRLAGRVSGDSTLAYGWAFCMAAESASETVIPDRAQWLRAVLLERERIANHLGDLGALGNDGGFAFGLAQFARLKEDWVRMNQQLFGHRYLMDQIVPGGVANNVDERLVALMLAECDRLEPQVRQMQRIYDEQSGLQDRFTGTGLLTPEVADHFGVCGLAGRASGRKADLRVHHPYAPYDRIGVRMASDTKGDVAARVALRFSEIHESIRLIRTLLADLPAGPIVTELVPDASASRGLGWVEGWRGDVLVVLETGDNGTITRCHCHDPSWQNWPALEHAIIGNIVADFPLINKSFNLSYSGHDL